MKKQVLLALMLSALLAQANTYYVATNGLDSNDGTTWPQAWQTLSNAVARVTVQDDVVLISNGIYKLADQIIMTNGIVLRGHAGPANVIVDGNYPTTTNRCFYISNAWAKLDALTITNGYATNNGGGIYMMGGMVTNCIVRLNFATNSPAPAGFGGGIYMSGQTSLVLNCGVWSNMAGSSGGGIYMNSNCPDNRVTGCTIYSNKNIYLSGSGHGVFVHSNSGILRDSAICYNGPGTTDSANQSKGGGVAISRSGVVSNCEIIANSASYGGGVGATGTGYGYGRLMNCRIVKNSSRNAGGGFYSEDWVGIVERCSIVSNYGVFEVAGIFLSSGITMRNCLIAQNMTPSTSSYTGPGCVQMGSANTARTNYIESCTIVSNQAGTTSVCVGLALSGDSAKLDRVYNTIIISNRTSAGAVSDIYCTNAVISNRFFNCLVMSNLPAAQGNIAAQPQFENFAARDMRLRLGSPGIDMGSNQTWMADAVDLNGLKRVMGFTRRVDMGCYETLPPSGTILCVH